MLYSFNSYKDMVVEDLQDRLGEENVAVITVPKNNGVKLQGVQLNMGLGMACPVMYFNEKKDVYDEADVMDFVDKATRIFHEAESFSSEVLMAIHDWELVKQIVLPKVINGTTNEETLDNKPHVRFLDLAVIFMIPTEGISADIAAGVITVNNSMMKQWGIANEELYMVAKENLQKSKYKVHGMTNVLSAVDEGEWETEEVDDILYMATTYDGNNGAAVILSTDFMKEAGRKMQCNRFYILPSSIHEILLVDCDKAELSALQNMVRDVNRTVLDAQDVLSDTVYIFENDCVKVA